MCRFAFTCFLYFFFFHFFLCFSQFVSRLFTHCSLVLIQALSLSACNNVNLFSTAMEQGKNTSSFFVILESLNALSTFYVYFLFPLVTLHVFLYFFAFFERKTLLKEEFYLVKWMKERRRGVFNLSCLIVWLTFYDGALRTCLFLEGKKKVH